MQESSFCEVIGCGGQACWLLVGHQEIYSEGLLCNIHWVLLHLHNSRRASRYTHLSDRIGQSPAASTENP